MCDSSPSPATAPRSHLVLFSARTLAMHTSLVHRFPRALVYHVVSNVAEYYKFVPWCVESRVLTQTDQAMRAELAVGFQLFTERYTSQVHMVPGVLVEVRETWMAAPELSPLPHAGTPCDPPATTPCYPCSHRLQLVKPIYLRA